MPAIAWAFSGVLAFVALTTASFGEEPGRQEPRREVPGAPVGSPIEHGIELYRNGEYERAVGALSEVCYLERQADASTCRTYLAFSYVALGENDEAREEFSELLSLSPSFHLNPETVSPKILSQFESARAALASDWFEAAKGSYYENDFTGAAQGMERVLQIEPAHELAAEYLSLAREQIDLQETLAKARRTEPQPENEVYEIGPSISPPVIARRSELSYPSRDRRDGVEGTVMITVVIDAQGRVRDARILRSLSETADEAALSAVREWQYHPALKDGRPVAVYHTIRLSFQLEK